MLPIDLICGTNIYGEFLLYSNESDYKTFNFDLSGINEILILFWTFKHRTLSCQSIYFGDSKYILSDQKVPGKIPLYGDIFPLSGKVYIKNSLHSFTFTFKNITIRELKVKANPN